MARDASAPSAVDWCADCIDVRTILDASTFGRSTCVLFPVVFPVVHVAIPVVSGGFGPYPFVFLPLVFRQETREKALFYLGF